MVSDQDFSCPRTGGRRVSVFAEDHVGATRTRHELGAPDRRRQRMTRGRCVISPFGDLLRTLECGSPRTLRRSAHTRTTGSRNASRGPVRSGRTTRPSTRNPRYHSRRTEASSLLPQGDPPARTNDEGSVDRTVHEPERIEVSHVRPHAARTSPDTDTPSATHIHPYPEACRYPERVIRCPKVGDSNHRPI